MSEDLSILDNKIILRSSFGKVGQKYFLQPAIDPATGRFPDHVKPVNASGDMILTEKERDSGEIFIPVNKIYEFVDGHVFNLYNSMDKAIWDAVKHNRIIAPNRYAKNAKGELIIDGRPDRYSSVAELYIYQPGYETKEKLGKKTLIHNASTYIYNDSAESRRKMFKLLNKNPNNVLDIDIIDYLLQEAEKNPTRIIDLYTGEDVHLRLLFVDAIEKGIILSKNRVYVYGDNIVLGATDDAVINYLRDSRNKNILKLIKHEVYGEELEITNPAAKEKLAKDK